MLTRILTAVISLAILIPMLLFAPSWCVSILFGILAALAAFEMIRCVGTNKKIWMTVLTAAICACGAALSNGILPQTTENQFLVLLGSCSLMTVLYMAVCVLQFTKMSVVDLVVQYGLCIYVLIGFYALNGLASSNGRVWVFIALCLPWIADTFAYFTGMAFGKKKLCPEISPKKTVAGAIGGIFGTGITAVVLFGFIKGWSQWWMLLIVFGVSVLLSILSIFGDLFASVVKRHYNIKDYGKLFPGHGGVMDRFDSTIPVGIILFVLYQFTALSEII